MIFLKIFMTFSMRTLFGFELIKTNTYSLHVEDLIHLTIVFLLARFMLIFIKKFILRISRKNNLQESDVYPIYTLIKYLVWILASILMLQAINLNVSVLLAGSAGLLVGIGIGLQDMIKNIIAGIMLLMGSRLKVGDYVGINGIEGKLVAIHLSASQIETLQGYYIFVPNSKIISDNIINWTYNKTPKRYFILIGVAYESDLKLVKQLLLDCLKRMQDIEQQDPYAPTVVLDDFADSAIMFKLFFCITDHTKNKMKGAELREIIAECFTKNHIVIPFPQRDVHIYNETTKS
ncbi:MAG: mechanosensitive ion channel family protein [Chitinophagaceae bacterium]